MKSQWIRIVIAILAAVCVSGCSAENLDAQSVETIETGLAESGKDQGNQGNPWQASESTTQKGQQGENAQTLNEELFDGLEMSIWNGKENTMLALKEDNLYLYDVALAQIKAETETEHWNTVTFYPYEGGYCAIGWIRKGEADQNTGTNGEAVMMEVSDDDMECLGIFYDDFLKEIQRISLNEITKNAAIDQWAVSSDGTMLVYYDFWDGLNLYEIKSRKTRKLLNAQESGNGTELLTIDALFFEKESTHMVFSGQSSQDGSTVASWGRIGTDGTGFENHILKHDFGTASGYSDGRLLIGEDSIFFKGGMAFVDTKTGEAAYNTEMKSTLPVSGPFFSADGTVFATAQLDTNQMEVAVYCTEDFSLLYKETVADDREEFFYRAPQICLFPDIRTCIVFMGGHNDILLKAVLLTY